MGEGSWWKESFMESKTWHIICLYGFETRKQGTLRRLPVFYFTIRDRPFIFKGEGGAYVFPSVPNIIFTRNKYQITVATFIFVGLSFHGFAETEMLFDIWIQGFNTCKWLLLLFMLSLCTKFCGLFLWKIVQCNNNVMKWKIWQCCSTISKKWTNTSHLTWHVHKIVAG